MRSTPGFGLQNLWVSVLWVRTLTYLLFGPRVEKNLAVQIISHALLFPFCLPHCSNYLLRKVDFHNVSLFFFPFTEPGHDSQKVLNIANQKLKTQFQIFHSTIQVELYQESVMRSCIDCQDLQDWNQIISKEGTSFFIPTVSLLFIGNGSNIYSLCFAMTIMIIIYQIPSLKQDLLQWMTFLSQSCASWLGSFQPVERKFMLSFITLYVLLSHFCVRFCSFSVSE